MRRASELFWAVSDRARVMWESPALRRAISGASLADAAFAAGQLADALVVAHNHAAELGNHADVAKDTLLASKAADILRMRLVEVAELGSRAPSSRDAVLGAPAEEAVQMQARQAIEDMTWLSDELNAGIMIDTQQMLLEAHAQLQALSEGA